MSGGVDYETREVWTPEVGWQVEVQFTSTGGGETFFLRMGIESLYTMAEEFKEAAAGLLRSCSQRENVKKSSGK